jgi:hypothetical protein
LRAHRERVVLAGAALPALAGFVLLTAGSAGSTAPMSDPFSELPAGAPPAIYARPVCSFSNEDAAAALVQGADGGASLVVGDRTYWLFGDTLFLAESGKQIEQNAIAWSSGTRADGCPELHYYTRGGVAVPFLAKDGSLTSWPLGAWPVDDHSFDFYTAYVYGSGPYAYWIGEVGVAHLDTRSMQTTVLTRNLWDARSGFPIQVIGAQPVDMDAAGRLRVVLQTKTGSQFLARVIPGQLAVPDAYEFWDGNAWSRSAAAARPLWPHDLPADPVQQLAAFENGASITYNAALHEYVALENVGIAQLGARTADRLEGPWSEPRPWLDCSAIAGPAVPTCYTPFQHPEFSGDSGRRLFITFGRFATYDTVAYELTLGTAIHAQGPGDEVAYTADPPDGHGWRDRGVAFYASGAPLPGFAAVYRWQRGADVRYALTAPEQDFLRGDVAFYAPAAERIGDGAIRYRPVFDWHHGTSHLLAPADASAPLDFEQGDVAFYAP